MSKQAYYKWLNNDGKFKKMAVEGLVLQFAREKREKDCGIGGLKLWLMYAKKSAGSEEYVGRDRFLRILREAGLLHKSPAKGVRTTNSRHNLPVYPDLRKQLVPERPDQEWDSDITYLKLQNGEDVYLHLTMDNYSHAVIGWKVSSTLELENTLEALEMAIANRKKGDGSLKGLIHHSDRGTQYCSNKYTKRLKEEGILISMTESGNPKDNPVAERLNNTIKNELFEGCVFRSVEEVENTLRTKLVFYNEERPHMSNGPDMLTPMEAYQCVGKMPRHWKSYRELAILKADENPMAPRTAPAGG